MTRRILLIEDEQLSQDIITSLLRGQGYSVDVAVDGFAALDRARSQRYDAALVDYHLPEMDGYTLGRLLREQHPGGEPGPVLIGLTADSNGLAARRGSDAVFRAILPKPIRPAELFSTIERLCEEAAANARPESGTEAGTGSRAANAMAPMPAGPVQPEDGRRAAAALWRSHGLAVTPRAFASPPPTIEQAAALTLCFDLVEPDAAQCILLLERHGINEAVRATKRAGRAPLPIIGLSTDHADICDRLFRVDDPASWKALSVALGAETTATIVSLPTASQPRPATDPDAIQTAPSSAIPRVAATMPVSDSGALPALPVGRDIATDLRALLVAGIQAPLEALRRDLATDAPAQTARLEGLDAILLATGTIADALNPQAAKATAAARFDPAELAGSAIAMIRDSRPAGSVALACRASDTLPARLDGDVHKLSQIVLTLLEDACAGPGPVALVLHLDFDAGRDQLAIRLFPDNDAPAGLPASRMGEGVVALLRNLRLTMLSQLVTMMGGTLARDAGEILLTVPATAAPAQTGHGEPAHVLLVDDAATSGQLLTLLLTQKGHHVCRVGDGEGAQFACRDARHDLVVFDLATGAQARATALAALRVFRGAQPALPIIVLADGLSPEDDAVLRDLRVVTTLSKPFSPDALQDAIALCRTHRQEPAAIPVEPIDVGVRAALVEALGEAAVTRLTGQLLAQIEALAEASAFDAEAVARLVELSGCAAVLGLVEIAGLCARPEIGAIRTALGRLRERLDTRRSSAA